MSTTTDKSEAQITKLTEQLAEKEAQLAELHKRLGELSQDQSSGNKDVAQRLATFQQALERAQKDGRMKTEFLMSMGHEIRTPLNGIMGMTNLVLETDLTSEQRRHLEMANSSAERLLDVVNDILDFCRIESGTLKLTAEDFKLSDGLDCDLYLLQLSARKKKIDLEYHFDRDVPAVVNGDPNRLIQVISHLVDNAIKFTDQGNISVRVENLGVDDESMQVLKFSVADTGVGIPPEKQTIIQDTFNQTYTSYARKFWGGGLGLTISAQLVHLAGGEIGLESSPGQGATFWFTWRFNQPVGSPVQSGALATQELSGGQDTDFRLDGTRILLAEDEPISRILIETLLEQAGLSVVVVENGRQAVEEARKGDYQAILMDVQMPVMDGLEATREIRAEERKQGGHLPIIALTAHAMHGDRERCLQAGMDDYLTKPIDKVEIFEMLSRYLTNTALVVDGNPESQQLVMEHLIESGWRVTLAETGRAAMYEASLTHFDLIILDIDLDAADGAETARVIRRLEEYSGRHALIIGVCNQQADSALLKRYRSNGVDDFISRPVSVEAVNKKLSSRT